MRNAIVFSTRLPAGVSAPHRTHLGLAICLALAAWRGGVPAAAATFHPISGSLTVRAGDDPQQMTPAVLGTVTLLDDDVDLMIGGFYRATTSLTTGVFDGSTFNFEETAASISNKQAPIGQPNATARITFAQGFVTAAPQWLQLSAKVDSPPADVESFASLLVTRQGQPAPVFSLGHTSGATITLQGLAPAGTFTVQGLVDTTATAPGSHAATIAGSIVIAALADFDGNLAVGGSDLPTWRSGFGSLTGTFADGNVDGDGDTDGADFLLWQRQVGTHALAISATTAAPEPGAGALLAAGGLAGAYCRTRRSAARRASTSPAR